MSIPGLLGSAASLKRKMGQKPCERCGLLYNPKRKDKCPHCGDLDDQGLKRLQERLAREHRGHRVLGFWFAVGAAFILFVLVLAGSIQ